MEERKNSSKPNESVYCEKEDKILEFSLCSLALSQLLPLMLYIWINIVIA